MKIEITTKTNYSDWIFGKIEADPYNKEVYNHELVEKTIKAAYKLKKQRLSKTPKDAN